MRSYHTQLRGGGNTKWYLQGMELSRTQFRTKRPVVLLPESDVAGLRLPPMYFVKRSAEWKDGRTEVVVRKLQWKKEDAGTVVEYKGSVDSQDLESVKITFLKGRTYYSTTLGTLWWFIANAWHKMSPLSIPGCGEIVPWYLTPVLHGYIGVE